MKSSIPIQDYDRLSAQVRSAWVHLNQAGDTPDAHRAILSLHAAVKDLLSADTDLHGTSDLAAAVARHHHSLSGGQSDAAEILRGLCARAEQLAVDPKASGENSSDALLAHSAIPVLWRMIRGVRQEIRNRRPAAYFWRVGKRALTSALLLAAAWAIGRLAWHALPGGASIAYYQGEDLARLRGLGSSRSVVQASGLSRPLPWMHGGEWSARWEGLLVAPDRADYSFYAQCEGGLRLWIDGILLVDQWESAGWNRGLHAQRTLDEGPHAFRMEFRGGSGASALRVRWTGGRIPPNTEIGPPYLRKY